MLNHRYHLLRSSCDKYKCEFTTVHHIGSAACNTRKRLEIGRVSTQSRQFTSWIKYLCVVLSIDNSTDNIYKCNL